MRALFTNKKTLYFLIIIQVMVILFLFFSYKNQEATLDNIVVEKNNSQKSQNNVIDKKPGDENQEDKTNEEAAADDKDQEELSRKITFLKKLYDYNNSEEYKNNILSFFDNEIYLEIFLNEATLDNIQNYHSKRKDIYVNIDKNIIYGFFDNEFIYISLEKHKDKYRTKRPHIIIGNLLN